MKLSLLFGLSVLSATVALDIPSLGLILFGGFEDKVAIQYSRFAPETWIQAYTAIPLATRQCLIKRLVNVFELFWTSQPFDISQHLAQTRKECPADFDKVEDFLSIVVADHHRLTPLVQDIFSSFLTGLSQKGLHGFRKVWVKYQQDWLKSTEADQQGMAAVYTKLKFIYNSPYSIPLTKQALAVAQCDYLQLPAFLITIKRIDDLAKKQNPTPPQGPYAKLHQVVHEDFAALRGNVATSTLSDVFQKKESYPLIDIIKGLTCTDN
jgi:hypothetical protein